MREAVVLDSFPSPACSHSDSMSRIDSPLTNAPITIARSGSVRNSFVLHGNSFETNGAGRLPHLGEVNRALPLERLHPAGAKPITQAPLILRPVRSALITRPTKPSVELILNRALDDQPGAQLGELRQRLPGILTHPHGKQLIDLLLDLRRRRYGASHGVGLPSWSCQDLREPTPCP
jgi:hypothetical protein